MRKPDRNATNQNSFAVVGENRRIRTEELSRHTGHSTLTFVTSDVPTEADDFDQLERVRRPVSRSNSGVRGKFADVTFGRSRHAESLNELLGFRVLSATGRCHLWQEQPFVLEYHTNGAKHRYVPDLLVSWGVYREVVEIKGDFGANLPVNQRFFSLMRELVFEHGYHFRVWKKSEIRAQPRLSNAGLVLRYRCVDVSAMERERIRRVFSATPDIRLRDFTETYSIAIQSVLRLVLEGVLHIDWWEPLTLGSRVNVTPIGRQVWPCPPYLPEEASSPQTDSPVSPGCPQKIGFSI
jgi:hypothetical protein